MSDLAVTITQQGFNRIFLADQSGIAIKVTEVALGSTGYAIATNNAGRATAVALQQERQRVPVSSGRKTGNRLELGFVVDGPQEYWIREIGYYLEDGTLFAIWSHPTQAMAYKSKHVPFLPEIELVLDTLPADAITINATLPPPTTYAAQDSAMILTALTNLRTEQLKQHFAIWP